MSRQLESIYIIKHYIITLFFDYHEFELEITWKKTEKFSFSLRKKIYLYSKNCGKIYIGGKMAENDHSH